MNIFAEIANTNRAYCAAHGLSTAELYGTAPNAAEIETHEQLARLFEIAKERQKEAAYRP